MADETGTVFGEKATEQIAKTVREDMRRMMNVRGNRGRWQFHGGDSTNTAFATISASDEDDEFQVVNLYRKAIPATFTTTSCGSTDFDDMEFTLSELIETGVTVLVPAGYKGGEAMLIKTNIGTTAHAWTGWVVFAGPTWRCATRIPTDVECCATTQVIKFTEYQNFWFFGKVTGTTADPCP